MLERPTGRSFSTDWKSMKDLKARSRKRQEVLGEEERMVCHTVEVRRAAGADLLPERNLLLYPAWFVTAMAATLDN